RSFFGLVLLLAVGLPSACRSRLPFLPSAAIEKSRPSLALPSPTKRRRNRRQLGERNGSASRVEAQSERVCSLRINAWLEGQVARQDAARLGGWSPVTRTAEHVW
ncbi:MAG: hypothetical protein WC483_03505, partial [Candidatus Paceibacterota bacterium]